MEDFGPELLDVAGGEKLEASLDAVIDGFLCVLEGREDEEFEVEQEPVKRVDFCFPGGQVWRVGR